jgi:carboxylesterase type B
MTTGCNQVAQNEILSCLQELEVAKIMTTKVDKDMLVYPWTPVLDYDFTPNPYLESKNVEHCFESGNFNTDLEIMIGTTADEGIFFIHGYVTGRKKWEDLKNNIETEGASQFFNIANKAEITSDVKRKIRQVVNHYIGSKLRQ